MFVLLCLEKTTESHWWIESVLTLLYLQWFLRLHCKLNKVVSESFLCATVKYLSSSHKCFLDLVKGIILLFFGYIDIQLLYNTISSDSWPPNIREPPAIRSWQSSSFFKKMVMPKLKGEAFWPHTVWDRPENLLSKSLDTCFFVEDHK